MKEEIASQVFSCQFCEIFKNIFFIEDLRWLLLPTLKPLDSQKQLCRWISKSVTMYFISTFLVLVGIFIFISGEHKLSFYISIALCLKRYDVFDFSRDRTIEVSGDLLGGDPSSWFSFLSSFGDHGPWNVDIKRFWFVTGPRDWCVT